MLVGYREPGWRVEGRGQESTGGVSWAPAGFVGGEGGRRSGSRSFCSLCYSVKIIDALVSRIMFLAFEFGPHNNVR